MDQLLTNLKSQIISTLKLTDLEPDEIDVDAPLIGEGLGLDSIDTLELLVLLEKEYGVTVPDINVGRKIFSSVRAMAEYIQEEQKRE
jgi:acyl carrier protein